MSRIANKTASIYTRIDPFIKNQAETILSALGISMSNAVEMFLRQVVIQRGMPFDIKMPIDKPLSLGSLNLEELDMELKKGYGDIKSGRVIVAEDVEKEIRGEYK